MLHSVRAVIVTGPYPCGTDSESGHDRLLFTEDCFGSIAQTLFVSGLAISEFLPNCAEVHIYFRFYVRPHLKVEPHWMTRLLLLPIMPTCAGIHATIIWIRGGYFFRRL